jgi:SNF2 family DNA or RNA helicase
MGISAEWAITDGQLALRTPDGVFAEVTATQVFSAAFGAVSTIAGFEVANPIAQLPAITFSRVAADPAIRLAGESLADIRCALGVAALGTFAHTKRGADHVLIGARWYPVSIEAMQDAETWLRECGINPDSPLTVKQQITLRQPLERPFELIDDTRLSTDLTTGIPLLALDGITATLYPYQVAGAAFLGMISDQDLGCVLGDEMGLGKTLQVIALLCSESKRGRQPSLVIAPATLLENWRRELSTFAPSLEVLVHKGTDRAGIHGILTHFDVVVTSFETAVRDEPMLSQVSWNVLVVDEAQNIKNPVAQRTIAAKRLRRRVSIAVTGTPLENRLEDLWSISDFCLPELLGSLAAFRDRYDQTVADAQRLGRVVAPVILRRRIADVATDLPELIEISQPLEMSAVMASMYEAIRGQALQSGPGGHLRAVTRLRQLCGHPSLVDAQWNGHAEYEMPKVARLLEILEEIYAQGQKVLIFASFVGLLDLLMAEIGDRWPSGIVLRIDGRTQVDERATIVDSFASFTGYGALLLNPKAAGVGLNITAANHVIHFTPEWNPAVTAQASARAYRRKQALPVTVHHLFFLDSVEEAIIDRARLKATLAREAVTGHEGELDASHILAALQKSPRKPTGTVDGENASRKEAQRE